MSIRDLLMTATKDAMKAREAARLSTLRMMSSAIKDRDIAAQGQVLRHRPGGGVQDRLHPIAVRLPGLDLPFGAGPGQTGAGVCQGQNLNDLAVTL